MAWTVTRGSTHQMKFMCKDEPNEQLVIGLVSSGLLQSTQDFVASTRKRAHQLQTMQAQKEEEMGGEDDDIGDETTMNPAEKKRRLTVDQVKFLEMSFSMDLKLEPERKAMIAKQLGLRPRQVAIWFQNRRARWKNKQLEHDFEALKTKYEAAVEENDAMVKENEALLEENTRLQAEVAQLRVLVQGQDSSCGGGVMEKSPLLPGSDSDMESGSMKEQKVEVEEAASPAKSDESQSYTSSSSCPIMTEAAVLAMVQEASTTISCTAAKFEPDVALSPSEELLGLISHPLLFQQIATGYQFNQMEDLYSSTWDHHLYGWGSQWDP